MAQSYSDLQRVFKNPVKHRGFSCFDGKTEESYDIDVEDIVSFYKHYCDTLFVKDFADWGSEPVLSVSEKCGSYVPVIGEFVLKSKGDSEINETVYIESIIKIYQGLLRKHFELNNENYETICVYMRTDSWWKGGICHRKIRLQFPFCRTKRDIINSVFNKDIVINLNSCEDISELTALISGEWDKSIRDTGEYVSMYGSTPVPKLVPPLKFMAVYGSEGENKILATLNINDVFTYDRHALFYNNKIDHEEIEVISDDSDIDDDFTFSIYTLPIFLSIHYSQVNVRFMDHTPSETASVIIEDENEEDEREDITNDLDLCNSLVKLLCPKRFNDKTNFLDIGRAYYNATDGGYSGLLGWMKSSEMSKKFDKSFCEQYYESFENDKVTARTLGWYLKCDNRKKYERWHEKWCNFALEDALDKDHTKVGEAFYRCHWMRYMYTGREWFEFKKNRLVRVDELSIKKLLTTKFPAKFAKMQNVLSSEKLKLCDRKVGSRATSNKMKEIDEVMERITPLLKSLKNEPYLCSLMKSIRTFYYRESITNVLDSNPSLLGCSNCVIELTDEGATKRDGKPEDFITKKLGVHYRTDYSYDHPDVHFFMRYLTQVFPVKEIKDLMLKALASFMYGKNEEKICWLFIGTTNGSKSVFQAIIQEWFGKKEGYTRILGPEALTAKNMNSSGPSPEMAQLAHSRTVFTTEPPTSAPISGALIKRFTGGDDFFARSCNKDGGSIEPTFKNIIIANRVPRISDDDEATQDRFIMVPFEGRWVKPGEKGFVVPETFEEQVKAKLYPIDFKFQQNNVSRLASAMFWVSVNNYKKYLEEGLQKPQYIQNFIDKFWKENDIYKRFMQECLQVEKKEDGSINEDKYITLTAIWPRFKSWYKESYPKGNVGNKNDFGQDMSERNRLGKQRARRWYGYSIITAEGDLEM